MLVSLLVTIMGLLAGLILVQRTGLRLGGVLVVPLLAVYTLYAFSALPLFLLSTTFTYIVVGVIRKRTLIHGRQLLLACLAVGAVLPVLSALSFSYGASVEDSLSVAFFGTIIPGMAAYNFHSLDRGERLRDLTLSLGLLVGLLAFGALLVTPSLIDRLPPALTSMLFTPASDIAQLQNAIRGNVPQTTSISQEFSFVLVGTGVILSEAAKARWGVRTGGLIAVPLLVSFSLSSGWVLPIYIGGVAVSYAILRLANFLTLLYGRALLTVTLIAAFVYALMVVVFTSTITGFLLYFTCLLAGIGAYNFHVVAPPERSNAFAVAGALFGVLWVVSQVMHDSPSTNLGINVGLDPELTSVFSLSVLVVTVAFICIKLYELETERRSVVRHHGGDLL